MFCVTRKAAAIAALFLSSSLTALAETPAEAFYSALRSNDLNRIETMLRDGADVNMADDRGITSLMWAVAVGSPEAMQLLIDKGANVNAKNTFNSTALIWAAADPRKVRILIDHGADVNAASKLGHTPLEIAAMSDPSAETVRLLISKGANIKAVDNSRKTVLYAATSGDDLETIRLLVDAGLDVNAADNTGQTPLMNSASNQNLAAVKLLLSKGVSVNAVTRPPSARTVIGTPGLGKFTALNLSCAFAPTSAEVVKTLLNAGADVNAQDGRGMTPIMLATATDHQDPEVIRALIAKGADLKIKDVTGETAIDWAAKFGSTEAFHEIERTGGIAVATHAQTIPPAAPVEIKPAVQRGIVLMEKAANGFFAKAGCVSCHSTNITDFAAMAARPRGIQIDEKGAQDRIKEIRTYLGTSGPLMLERRDGPGAPDLPLYSMAALAQIGYPADRMTDSIAANIAIQQLTSGRWHKVQDGVARPPLEDGDIFRTTLSIRLLRVYGPPGRAAEFEERIQRAKAWLLSAEPLTTEDRNMQLLGLYWAGTDEKTLHKLAKAILATQRSDGGWVQRAEPEADAYATGQTLFALTQAGGVSAQDPAYVKGVKYLLSTQRADGSWYVRSRAPKFQPYFESGFPYGHDQWISSMATGWATTALALAIDEPGKAGAPAQPIASAKAPSTPAR